MSTNATNPFLWIRDGHSHIINAPDQSTAYKMAVTHLIKEGRTITEAVGMLAHHSIEPAAGLLNSINCPAYEGELPDEVESAESLSNSTRATLRESEAILDFDDVFNGSRDLAKLKDQTQ